MVVVEDAVLPLLGRVVLVVVVPVHLVKHRAVGTMVVMVVAVERVVADHPVVAVVLVVHREAR